MDQPRCGAVRQVTVTAPHIRSLAFKVNSGTEGFIGYGAVFEADGVVVDRSKYKAIIILCQ